MNLLKNNETVKNARSGYKNKAFKDANVQVADIPSQVVDLIKKVIKEPIKV